MGLLDRLLSNNAATLAMKEAPASPIPPATSIPIDTTDIWPTDDEFAGYVNGMYCREYAVRTVVDFIARNIASLPLKVYRRDGNGDPHEVTDGDLYRLLRKPSPLPGMTRYRFIQSLISDMLLEDRWLCILGTVGDRWTLRRIPSDCYTLNGNALGEISSVDITLPDAQGTPHYDLPNGRVILDVGSIDHLRYGNPLTDVLRPLLAEARAMARYRRQIAQHGAQIPAYVYRPKEVPWNSQADYNEFVQGLRQYSQGGGLEGFWPTFKDGMEIRTVDNVFKPVDVADLDARKEINILVATAFQISPENIGFRTGTNSNISAYKDKLWNVELMPYVTAFEEALNLNLPEYLGDPDCYIRANIDAKLRGTFETQYQALSTATGRPFMTTNEGRRTLDLAPVDGGDDLITPLNVTEGGQPSPQDGGQTQNAQQGKTARAIETFGEFQRLHAYDARFRSAWDNMKGQDNEV